MVVLHSCFLQEALNDAKLNDPNTTQLNYFFGLLIAKKLLFNIISGTAIGINTPT